MLFLNFLEAKQIIKKALKDLLAIFVIILLLILEGVQVFEFAKKEGRSLGLKFDTNGNLISRNKPKLKHL